MNHVLLLSGPPGAGKSAVAAAICERYDRMLLVEVDELRQWVKAGYRHPWAEDALAAEQRLLALRNACAIAREAVALRYAVVIADPMLAEQVPWYRELLEGIGCEVHFVLLLPTLAAALARDAGRGADSIPERVRALHAQLSAEAASGRFPGVVLDTTQDANAQLTADRLQDAVATGVSLFVSAPARGG
ncbi:MAG: AAA family ATPase [Dehalococcoidia bacterium]|nr:AAA family ATPase [Dehalococcoidia bacterium]